MKNNFKLAFRSLKKNRLFSGLNMLGLSMGLAVFFGLTLFGLHELSFDKFHSNAKQLHRIVLDIDYEDIQEKYANAPSIIGPKMTEEVKDVLDYCRFMQHGYGQTAFLEIDGRNYAEDKLFWADASLFELFDVSLIAGDAKTALKEPYSLVLGETAAKRIFGNLDPMGKVLKLDNKRDLTVTGIYKDFPSNSSFDAELFGSFSSQKWAYDRPTWDNASFETFLLLHPEANPSNVQSDINAIHQKNIPVEESYYTMSLQPLNEMHLYSSDIENDHAERTGDASQVRLVGILALAVLLLACFNYINLGTAQSQQRSREVGISKTLGATRFQLIRRFYAETGLLVAISIILAVLLLQFGLPFLKNLTGAEFDMLTYFNAKTALVLLCIWGLITFFTGLYPAFFLSSFSAKSLLNPLKAKHSADTIFRKSLVIGQFVICSGLIMSALVFNKQVDYLLGKKLGFDPAQVVQISGGASSNIQSMRSLKAACENHNFVKAACIAKSYPGSSTSGYSISSKETPDKSMMISVNYVEQNFEDVLGLEFLAGAAMPKKAEQDTTIEIVINETTSKFLGFLQPEDAIGKSNFNMFRTPTQITGVVKDFHHESLHQEIKPYAFSNGHDMRYRPNLLVKIGTENLIENMQILKETYTAHVPDAAFKYTFVDSQIAQLYANESRLRSIVTAFMFLAIFIAALGLFGLAAFSAEQRTKEIGIRKVLGASVAGIVALLSKDYVRLCMLAFLIAAPLAYFLMENWLNGFAFRIGIDISFFMLSILGVLAVVLLSVGYQSVRAAVANPVDAVRD